MFQIRSIFPKEGIVTHVAKPQDFYNKRIEKERKDLNPNAESDHFAVGTLHSLYERKYVNVISHTNKIIGNNNHVSVTAVSIQKSDDVNARDSISDYSRNFIMIKEETDTNTEDAAGK